MSAPTTADVQRELDETRATLPIVGLLPELFSDPKMFGSFDRFAGAGFSLVDHPPHKIMTGRHKRAKGFLFKKYDDDKAGGKQLRNYMRRIEGARLLRTFITERGFSSVVAPRKWLYELPESFPARHLLVVERLALVSRPVTEAAYRDIDEAQMRELATILFYFRGLNSTASNLPFTDDDKIAFVDTERWHHDKDLLRKVGDHLSVERIKQARSVFKKLRGTGARPFTSAFK